MIVVIFVLRIAAARFKAAVISSAARDPCAVEVKDPSLRSG